MNTFTKTLSKLAVVVCCLFTPVQAAAAVELFLLLDGVRGDSQVKEYVDGIDIVAWSEGLSIAIELGGAQVGRPIPQSISITKFIDSASPDLRFNLAKAVVHDNASIIVSTAAGDSTYESFRIDLSNVRIEAVSASGSSGEDRLMENVSLQFDKIKWTYMPPPEKGGDANKIVRGWDFIKNAAF